MVDFESSLIIEYLPQVSEKEHKNQYFSTEEPDRWLRDHVRNYAEHQGGTVLFCGAFTSWDRMPTIDMFFASEWQLPWAVGGRYWSTADLNPAFRIEVENEGTITVVPCTANLEKAYSQKAVHLKEAPSKTMLYVTTEDSRCQWPHMQAHPISEDAELWPDPILDSGQSPVVFSAYGKGNVGFLGDAYGEIGTKRAIITLCGWAKV
ncbi:hypothetical protein MMC18_004991 [Xylographa bjoerkii]|nr:hypothetical protein [Xylographa bjoerkii]